MSFQLQAALSLTFPSCNDRISGANLLWLKTRNNGHRSAESGLGQLEYATAFLIILFPVMGTFFAPDQYFAIQSDSLRVAMGPSPPSEGIGVTRLGFYFTLMWLMFQSATKPTVMVQALRQEVLPILFVLLAMSSALWSPDFSASFNTGVRLLIISCFSGYISYRCSPIELIGLITRCLGVSAVASIFAVVVFPEYGYSTLDGYADAWRGVMVHKNMLGELMSFGALAAYYSLKLKANARLTSIGVLFACLLLVIMSRSATSITTVCILVPAILFLNRLDSANTSAETLAVLISGLIFSAGAAVLVINGDAILELIGRSSTLTGRSEIWPTIWRLIQERPLLGYGHGFWSIQTPLRDGIWINLGWVINNAHDAYLDIWFQLGVVGLTVFISMILVILWRSWRILEAGTGKENIFFMAVILAVLFRSLTETTLVEPGMPVMFWFSFSYAALSRKVRAAHSVGWSSREGRRHSERTAPEVLDGRL